MAIPRASRVRLIWWLELGLGLELYACAVLAVHARGLRATPLLAAPALVIPALVIPPLFYLLVGLVSLRPFSLRQVLGAAVAMCGFHALLIAATGALYTIPDLLDFGSAVAFALWGSPAVTLLQLTAAPLVFARLRPLLSSPRPAPRAQARATPPRRRAEVPGGAAARARDAAWSLPPREPAAMMPSVPPLQRVLAVSSSASAHGVQPVVASPLVPQPVVTPPAPAPPAPPTRALVRSETGEPMIRISFGRIADQLPVEMFARGREGLHATLRPGVSLLVPRRLLLPYLGEALAPVKWEVVADQFPRAELALSHEEIAGRLPHRSLLLPLDEVVPQIPAELLALSTPAANVYGIEEFPPPFQPHVPPPSETPAVDTRAPAEPVAVALAEPEPPLVSEPREEPEPPAEPEASAEPEGLAEAEPLAEPELFVEPLAPAEPKLPGEEEPSQPERGAEALADRGRTAEARRITALLAPLMNGLEIGERDEAGTTLVTVVAPTLSEDSVVRTAARVVPFLADARLSDPVAQATLTGAEATIVLTPFGSPGAGGALLVTAVRSRASLAWLERLSRSAAGEARVPAENGGHSSPVGDPAEEMELRATSVPQSVRELAGSLTAFGPVAPTVLRDTAGSLRACLFLPRSLEAIPLAQFARDLYAALEEAEIGQVSSVILRVGAHRLVVRAMDGVPGRRAAMLVGGGPIDRPGLARIELDRAATRLGALVRG